ncbi:MAG TPA: NAD-dependent epimerase/dehydratase family protein, partial [Thermoanaerobaculia bacterium]
ELAIQEWAKKGLKVNTVYPSLVYGPPGKKEGANSILRQLLKGRFPAVVGADRKTSWIFLDDVVDAMVKLIDKAPVGRDYLLTGDITTLRSLVDRVCALGGVKPPRLTLPIGVARAAITLAGPLYRMRGRRPPVAPDQLDNLARHWAFSDARARTELGWTPRTLDEGLPPTVRHIQATG